MKHKLLIGLTTLLLLTGTSALMAQKKLFFIGDNDFPPFSFKQEGKIVGRDVEIVEAIAKRLKFEINIALFPFKRLLEFTKAGKCDGSFALFKTPEREQFAHYVTAKPLHESTYKLFVLKGKSFPFTSLEHLKGKTIGKNLGFAVSPEFDKMVRENVIKVVEAEGIRRNMINLYQGEVDAISANYHVLLHMTRNDDSLANLIKKGGDYEALARPIKEQRGAFLVLSKAAKNIADKPAMVQKINRVIGEMQADGSWGGIYQKYIGNGR